jgi:hypothetical protein
MSVAVSRVRLTAPILAFGLTAISPSLATDGILPKENIVSELVVEALSH